MCQCDQRHFSAYASGDGDGRSLVVDGVCTCPRAGFTLELESDTPEAVTHARDVVLRLRAVPPSVGVYAITPRRIFHRCRIGAEAERVIVRLPHGQPELVLPIIDGEDH
jgi:hypothetical protein